MVAAKPLPGAVIEFVWGNEVHDVVEQNVGVTVACAPLVGNGFGVADITTIIEGVVTMADLVDNSLKPLASGVYEIQVGGLAAGITGGFAQFSIYRNGTPIPASGAEIYCSAAAARRFPVCSRTVKLNAGDRLQLVHEGTPGGTGTLTLTFDYYHARLVANAYGN